MAQSDLTTESAIQRTVAVEFLWGSSSAARYIRWTDNVTINGDVYTADGVLTAALKQAMGGTAKDEQVEVLIPTSKEPIASALKPYKHSKVSVRIMEVDPNNANATVRTLFFGKIQQITSSANSRGIAKVLVSGIKARLALAKLGVQATTTCQHVFGDELCGFDLAAAKMSGTVNTVGVDSKDTRISIDLVGSVTGLSGNSRFARGFVEVDGTRIMIRQVVSLGPNPDPLIVLDLAEVPNPATWTGASASVAPGCDKSLAACRDPFRDREESFLGLGFGMPAYNPTFEESRD